PPTAARTIKDWHACGDGFFPLISSEMTTPDKYRTLGFWTATNIVVANMVGTGVFTSLGFQAQGISSKPAILALWVLGGVIALCGGLSYGELGAAFPLSGGEYVFLSRLFRPALGFLSGFISSTVGFA